MRVPKDSGNTGGRSGLRSLSLGHTEFVVPLRQPPSQFFIQLNLVVVV